MTFHEGKLELEGDEYVIADASLNPKYRTVQHWHNVWREFNLGPRIGEGVIEVGIYYYLIGTYLQLSISYYQLF